MTPQKRAALASLHDLLPALTESELWRLAGLARAILRQRIEGPTAADWESAVDAVLATALHHGLRVDDLTALAMLLAAHRDGAPPT